MQQIMGTVRRAVRSIAAVTTTAVVAVALAAWGPAPALAAPVQYDSPPVASWRLNGQGFATALVGNTAYVGGQFTTATNPSGGTASRVDLAAFDATTGALVNGFRADSDGIIRALATDGSWLYVGGSFSHLGGVARQNLARVNLSTGAVDTSWNVPANKVVWALTVSDGVLYAGGAFNRLDGIARGRIGSIDIASANVTNWAPTAAGQIRAIAVDPVHQFVYAGGRQTAVNGTPSEDLTKIDFGGNVVPVTFTALGNYGQGLDLNSDGSRLAVAGADNRIHWFDTSTGQRYWSEHCDGNGQAVKIIEDTVVGGFHDGCDHVSGRDLVLLDVANGNRDNSFLPVFNLFWGVRAIDGNSSVLVVAGKMTNVDGQHIGSFAIFPAR